MFIIITQIRKQTEIGKNFLFVGAKIWQDVPQELMTCSFNVFKRKLENSPVVELLILNLTKYFCKLL